MFEDVAAGEMAVEIEMVVDRGVDSSEFLQGFDVPEIRHRTLSSPKRLVRVFGPVIEPPFTCLALHDPNHLHRSAVGAKPVCQDGSWPTVAFHRTLDKIQRSAAIPAFCGKNLKHFAFMINRPPQIVRLAVDPNEHLVQVPAPL